MPDNSELEKEIVSLKDSVHELQTRVKSLEEAALLDKRAAPKIEAPELKRTNLAERSIAKVNSPEEQIKAENVSQTITHEQSFQSTEKKNSISLPKVNFINLFGAFTVVLAVTIFFKIAVDNGWIGPVVRVLLGYIFGLAAIGVGEYCQKKDYKVIAIGFIGLGQVVLFLTTWFAENSFHLINWWVSFASYFAITALMAVQALRYNSQAIAVFGVIGGFLVPCLAPSSDFNLIQIACYYLILTGGVLFIACQKAWNILKWLSFASNYIFLFIWSIILILASKEKIAQNPGFQLHNYLIFLAVFFVLYAAIASYRAIKKEVQLDIFDLCLVIANGVFSLLLALIALKGEHLVYLGIACILVSFVYAFLSRLLMSKETSNKRDFHVFLTVSVVFLTIAIRLIVPIKFVSITWALQAIVLAYLSQKEQLAFLRFNYSFILAIIAIRLMWVDEIFSSAYDYSLKSYTPFALPTISGLVSVAAFFYCLQMYEKSFKETQKNSLVSLMLWGAILFASLLSFSREFDGFSNYAFSNTFAKEVHISLLLLIGSGMVWLFCKTQLQKQNTAKLVLISCFAFVLFFISLDTLFALGTYQTSESIIAHLITLVLFSLIFNLFTLRKNLQTNSERLFPIILFCTGIIIVMSIIRREAHLITYSLSNRDIYQISLSVSYSLLALATYLWGLLKKQKSKIWISYALFVFVGLKVYFNDLADLEQLYRGLSLLVFGSILLLCSFLEQKIKRLQPSDSSTELENNL